jgi:hypothetical protein
VNVTVKDTSDLELSAVTQEFINVHLTLQMVEVSTSSCTFPEFNLLVLRL